MHKTCSILILGAGPLKERWHGQKGNETNAENIDFVLQVKIGDKCLFYIVLNFIRISLISATRCAVEMGFGSKCSI